MDQMDVSLAGRINVRGDGNVVEDRFSLTASADFAKGGRITLNANPGFRPSAALKDGKTNLTDASQLSGIGNLDDIDVSISKSADILGQACDLTLSTESLGNGGIAGLQVKTNVDKVETSRSRSRRRATRRSPARARTARRRRLRTTRAASTSRSRSAT